MQTGSALASGFSMAPPGLNCIELAMWEKLNMPFDTSKGPQDENQEAVG